MLYATHRKRGISGGLNVRSLLAGEALEDDLGVAVDTEVLDGSGIGGRRGGAVCAACELRQTAHR